MNFVLYNRTQRVLNASFEQTIDADTNLMAHTQVYKMMKYTRNTFGAKDIMSKIATNIKPCNLKK
ncbi:hypothetical protein ILUMI_17446, partial [Ignelater luminosus]